MKQKQPVMFTVIKVTGLRQTDYDLTIQRLKGQTELI